MKFPFYIAILMVIGSQALIFNGCAPYHDDHVHEKIYDKNFSASDVHKTFSVDNIPCSNCFKGIVRTLDISGIKKARIKIGSIDNLEVIYDPQKINEEEIKKAIRATGKEVK
ncbi:MAG: heavy-metal-associated domain-containing protein [Myxococcales bacterium]|nr:heavy-metal-associated domain-containing protein [Myxococcales bacterium]USN51532.1 MAG: heavy-metal-associated domain-containing protein [Myxococcales bacterium]